jgi:FMN-dependent oxidoreductase (nitrilotriacetate monooxygenase family)
MSGTDAREMTLFAFLWNTGAHVAGWRHPSAGNEGLHSLAFFQHLATVAERGKLDAIFFADSQGFHRVAGRDAFSRTDLVKLEPLTLLAALAATTRHIGLVATASTTYSQPYTLARQFASIDHLSRGRAGWNIVTSTAENEAHNFGLDKNYGHAERYERATEFVEVVQGLWDSFEDDALLRDKASGRYLDPQRLHGLGHAGKFLTVSGPLNIARPPQGHPVLVQAGSSDTGRHFAARFAEAIFTSHPVIDSAREFYRDIKTRVAGAGRDPRHVKVLASVQPIIGSTEAEARALEAELDALVHIDLAVATLGNFLGGIDLSGHPLDGPLPPIPETENARSTRARVLDWAEREHLTIRQIAQRVAAQRTSKNIVGTPEQIADVLCTWFREGAADGFIVGAPILPAGLEVFVTEVVPILQRRGVFRGDYRGATLRENLGLPRPANLFQAHPERHVEPDIW